ncbi:hypothetical protein B484DRAFT_397762 [Ochromonadaceae sp. CCMP2298]|nr:hypothetical protein B484DRAFT_397762 [Ochromonadaceae sp. CCMP2298]
MSAPDQQGLSGYELDMFVATPDERNVCTICLKVLRKAQSVCQNDHIFCTHCISKWVHEEESDNRCPVCKCQITQRPARNTNEMIEGMAVQCLEGRGSGAGVGEGSGASGAGGEEADEMATKKRRTLQREMGVRNTLSSSSSSSSCCNWVGALSLLEEHKKTCPFVVEACPYTGPSACSARLPRRDLIPHIASCVHRTQSECILEWTSCPYKALGCSYKAQRRHMGVHCDDTCSHLSSIASKFEAYEKRMEKLEGQVGALQRSAESQASYLRAVVTPGLASVRNVSLDGTYSGQMKGLGGPAAMKRHGFGRLEGAEGVYEGEWEGGLQHGRGCFTAPDWSYEGEWRGGKKQGEGYIAGLEDGEPYTYSGSFEEDQRQGNGTYTHEGETYQGDWRGGKKEGQGTIYCIDGAVYVGGWVNNQKEGGGVFTHSNGDVYEGEFEADMIQGQGTCRFANGDTYTGGWIHDMKNGTGVDKTEGITYTGDMKDNARSGQGTCVHADGDVQDGQWKRNFFEGHGEYQYKDGSKYVGFWKTSRKHGDGTLVEVGGVKVKGTWKQGAMHGTFHRKTLMGKCTTELWEEGTKVAKFKGKK